eukprot:3014247-Ditylum_brightwellii.AAC.1
MENRATEMAEWCITFNADQKKRFKEQDKKMTKQLDIQSNNVDNKMDALATSLQDQLSTNQQSLKQMMHDQEEHLVSNLNLLLGTLTNTTTTVEKNSNTIIAIQNKFEDTLSGPLNKHQKHKNMEVEIADIVGNANDFHHSSDTHTPDSEGVGGI